MKDNRTYKEAYAYLDQHYAGASSVGEFEKTHVGGLARAVEERMGALSLPFEREEVRHALLHFYAAHGIKAMVVFDREQNIVLRKQAYDLDNNLFIELFTKRLIPYKTRLKPDSKQPNMLFLEYEALSSFLPDLLEIEDEHTRVEAIKRSIKRAFDLSENDVVLLRNDKIAIKCSSYQQTPSKSQPTPAEEKAQGSGQERRYEGLSPEEMESYFANLSKKYDLRKLLHAELKVRFADELNLKKIDNFYFAKNFIRIFQKVITTVLDGLVDEDQTVLQGLANFILRHYFDDLLQRIAEKLIELLIEKDPNATDFIKFYNGDTAFTADGARYTKPDILDDEGKRWNASTILQIAMQRRAGIAQLLNKKKEIEQVRADIQSNEEQEHALREELKKLEGSREEAEKNAASAFGNVNELKDKLVQLRTEANKSSGERLELINGEITKLSLEIKKQSKVDEELFKIKRNVKMQTEKIEIKVNLLRRERQSIHKKLKVEETKLQQLALNQEPLEQKNGEVVRLLAKTLPKFRV